MKKLLLLLLIPITVNSADITKVALIDSGIDFDHPYLKDHICKSGHKDFTDTTPYDTIKHGTHVAGLIVKYAGNAPYCIVSFKVFEKDAESADTDRRIIKALREAVSQGIKYVNFSGGGPTFIEREYNIIKDNPDITFVVAAGNFKSNIDLPDNEYYPASYNLKNIISVGCIDKNNKRCSFSNFGKSIKAWEIGDKVKSSIPDGKYGYMSGTSMSTAIKMGKIIYEHQKP